ncbi:hypothetical protein PPERSA_04010 [Pseudocohnilembus persalinus]|uniref:Uncharacterized protein n=1 Tax=Pseudocohnilembus persalinus TaxID=266149 RepID=A0A0V0QKT8_PSEPJ|nr:hypothetical protein PPERSA_04010 [Pseudocohnilembus persalinus]|eukprot:KRX02807.1 hypothetical protein PPERSA_04010 [Pseudocohnilembus persalinus]
MQRELLINKIIKAIQNIVQFKNANILYELLKLNYTIFSTGKDQNLKLISDYKNYWQEKFRNIQNFENVEQNSLFIIYKEIIRNNLQRFKDHVLKKATQNDPNINQHVFIEVLNTDLSQIYENLKKVFGILLNAKKQNIQQQQQQQLENKVYNGLTLNEQYRTEIYNQIQDNYYRKTQNQPIRTQNNQNPPQINRPLHQQGNYDNYNNSNYNQHNVLPNQNQYNPNLSNNNIETLSNSTMDTNNYSTYQNNQPIQYQNNGNSNIRENRYQSQQQPHPYPQQQQQQPPGSRGNDIPYNQQNNQGPHQNPNNSIRSQPPYQQTPKPYYNNDQILQKQPQQQYHPSQQPHQGQGGQQQPYSQKGHPAAPYSGSQSGRGMSQEHLEGNFPYQGNQNFHNNKNNNNIQNNPNRRESGPNLNQQVIPEPSPRRGQNTPQNANMQQKVSIQQPEIMRKQKLQEIKMLMPSIFGMQREFYSNLQAQTVEGNLNWALNQESKLQLEVKPTLDPQIFNILIAIKARTNEIVKLKLRLGPFEDLYEIIDCNLFSAMKKNPNINLKSNDLQQIIKLWGQFTTEYNQQRMQQQQKV